VRQTEEQRQRQASKIAKTGLVLLLIGEAVLIGWMIRRDTNHPEEKQLKTASGSLAELPACRLALAATAGDKSIDAEIARLQTQIKSSPQPRLELERLGWTFVKKARLTFDTGFYKLAEQCAACMDATGPKSPEALLLRAHVLQSLHRFSEAETLARDLLTTRTRPFDYAVLGDVLIDQGKIREAAAAYQRMIDLRPDLQSYTRAAHVRWLTGDLGGAIELMKLATSSSSPNDPEAAAWAYTRLALYQLQQKGLKQALQSCDEALSLQSDYAPALVARARVLLLLNRSADALSELNRATSLNPLLESQWMLADVLREVGDVAHASLVECEITKLGATEDSRTFSLYLATRRENLNLAIQLAEQELTKRRDIFTYDALAWALSASGRNEEALLNMKHALLEGTQDARLFFHAGVIATLNKQEHRGGAWLKKAYAIRQMLLPGERLLLNEWLERIKANKSH
jgi:tetratricopeptide (TPR) repeat protein